MSFLTGTPVHSPQQMAQIPFYMHIYSEGVFTDIVITCTSRANWAVIVAKAVIQSVLFLSCSGWKEQLTERDSQYHTIDLLHDFQLLGRGEEWRGPCSAAVSAVSSPEHLSVEHGNGSAFSPWGRLPYPGWDRCVPCPAPSVIKRPSCAVTSGTEAGVIRDPVSAPSEEGTQTLTGQLRVKPRTEYLWRTTASSPPRTPVGATSARRPSLLPEQRIGPHQPCQSIRKERITPHLLLCVSSKETRKRRTGFWQIFSPLHCRHKKCIWPLPFCLLSHVNLPKLYTVIRVLFKTC